MGNKKIPIPGSNAYKIVNEAGQIVGLGSEPTIDSQAEKEIVQGMRGNPIDVTDDDDDMPMSESELNELIKKNDSINSQLDYDISEMMKNPDYINSIVPAPFFPKKKGY